MSEIIWAAIITASAILGAPAVGFIFSGFYKSWKTDLFKKGDKFKGEWKLDNSEQIFKDELVVESTWFGKIKCNGILSLNGSSKSYKLFGKQYRYCSTFEYLGTDKNKQHDETAGVVIINNTSPDRNNLYGRWSQLNIHGQLIGGEMQLTRTV